MIRSIFILALTVSYATAGDYAATTTAGYQAPTTAPPAATTAGYQATTGSSGGSGTTAPPSGGGDCGGNPQKDHGHLRCKKVRSGNKLIDLDPIASLENFCLDFCKNSNCSHDYKANGLLGSVSKAARCLLDEVGNAITPLQSCYFPCILNLNVLETCDVTAIAGLFGQICPNGDKRARCLDVCACCATSDDPKLLDVCVNLCLTDDGVKLDVNPLKIL